jgi:hypothetical protein
MGGLRSCVFGIRKRWNDRMLASRSAAKPVYGIFVELIFPCGIWFDRSG